MPGRARPGPAEIIMSELQANADLIADYLGEAHDYLDQLNKVLLHLSEVGGEWPSEQVNEMFRSAHSLKGLSACFGFERSNKVTHQLESLLTLVRDGKLVPTQVVVRGMFDAVDLVAHLTAEIAGSGHEHADIDISVEALKQAAKPQAAGTTAETAGARDGDAGAAARRAPAEGSATSGKSPGGDGNETVRVRMDRLDRMVNLTGELVITRSRFQLVSRQMRPLQRMHELAANAADLFRGIEELGRLPVNDQQPQNGLQQLAERLQGHADLLRDGMAELAGVGRAMRDLDEAAYDLDGVVSGIHESVLQLRMVPLETVFRRLQRVVRDTSELVGKPIDLEIRGGDTQIDKRVADEIVNPLVHILRNAVDHGIERPDDRTHAGKQRAGKITVNSFQRGSSVVIEIVDDGGGIDPERLLKKAIEKGILSPEEAAVMPADQAQRLIFAPGFSTAAAITEVSGRGMGMDIVVECIKKLRGTLDLASVVGQGTTFTIQLPPSMSILSSLLIEVRGTMFALPLTEVREIVELARSRIHTVQGRPVIVVRDQPMPLVAMPLTYHFAGSAAADANAVAPLHAIVFGFANTQVALGVDRLLGKEDLVIKPLCAELAAVRGLAGMAIRGDGRVTLILDPTTFAEHALSRIAALASRTAEAVACPSTR
jgi:two-component system, chemotaxis family, sensor kinase CheA